MREILFRGKGTSIHESLKGHESQWHYGYFWQSKIGTHVIREPIKDGEDVITHVNNRDICVDPKTVGQYTGLKDKNDRKIFEGDIFKFDDEVWESCYTSCGTEYDSWPVTNYGEVGFHEDTQAPDFVRYKFGENQIEASLHENHDVEFYDFVKELEIVGNIYDNPELLEE